MDKKTKILATLGPASNSLEMIEKLIDAGANMFRLNFSHGSHEYHQETLDNIRQAMQNKDCRNTSRYIWTKNKSWRVKRTFFIGSWRYCNF